MKVKKKIKFKKPERQKNGQFKKGQSGNPAGRKPLGEGRKDELWRAIHCVETRLKRPWLESLIERSYSEPSLALGLLSRLYPSLKAVEMSGGINTSMPDAEAKLIQDELRKRIEDAEHAQNHE